MKLSELSFDQEVSNPKETKSILEREINLFPHKVSSKEKELIYRQLFVLQQSGVDVKTSFEILLEQLKRKKTKEKLEKVLQEVIKGKSLSDAMSAYTDFSAYEIYSLKIGEETGKLMVVLEKLTEYFENQIAQRRQIVSALSYPFLIVFTSMIAVSFMIFFIIPMFEEVFARFGSELPALTQLIISFSHSFRDNFPLIFLLIVLVGSLAYFFRKKTSFKQASEWIWLRVPVAGEIYKSIYLARFCDSMGLLIQSSVPMIRTLDMVRQMVGMLQIEKALTDIEKELIQGSTISKAFHKHKIFDSQLLALVKVGEEVNQLGNFFQKLAKDYSDSVRHKTSILSSFLEPIMIIFLGLVVGVILVAMYLPMFELSSNMEFGN